MHNCFCGGQAEESVCLISPSTGRFLEPVLINVYDMHWSNEFTSTIGFGIYHTGIEIYGIEYAYAGHPYQFTGIFEMIPRDQDKLGDRYRFRQSIRIGYTSLRYDEIEDIINSLAQKFRGDRYHLINNNCNHFTSEISKRVCGKPLPHWLNRLASVGSYLPYVERLLPKEWVRPLPSRSQNRPNSRY